jgi:hypothetical protein
VASYGRLAAAEQALTIGASSRLSSVAARAVLPVCFGSSDPPTYGFQVRGTPGFKIVGFAGQPLPS